jgi:membrane fusion protein (multidrug efflux system)
MGQRLNHPSDSRFVTNMLNRACSSDTALGKVGLFAALLACTVSLSQCDHKEEGHAGHGAKEEQGVEHAEHKAAHEGEDAELESQLILTRPLVRDTVVTRDFVCQIRACRNIKVCALERGYLQVVQVNEGQMVKEGQVMFQILPLIYQANLRKEEAESQVAQVDYSNTKRLMDMNVVSDKELALSKARLDMTLAQVNMAKTHLGFTTIKAAFTGLMDRLRLRNGSLVNEGDLLTTLSDNSEIWVYFNVTEETYLNYMSEKHSEEVKQVRLIMANGKMFDQPGRINVIEGEFDNTTGTIPFRADFPNPKGLLRHGETGIVQMKKTVKNALLVPQKATFESGDSHYIYVVDKDHIAHQRKIVITEELEDVFVISSGVTEKDEIIFEGQRQAHEGYKLQDFVFEEPVEAFKNLKLKAE